MGMRDYCCVYYPSPWKHPPRGCGCWSPRAAQASAGSLRRPSDHGARVHVCDIDGEALKVLPKEMTRTVADVAKPPDVDRLFSDVERKLGGLDVLVHNAG